MNPKFYSHSISARTFRTTNPSDNRGRQFDEVFEIRKIEVRYAGDTLIAPVSVSYQPEGFEFPIKLISMFEIRLSFQAESLDFGGTTPVPESINILSSVLSRRLHLTCAADPTVPKRAVGEMLRSIFR